MSRPSERFRGPKGPWTLPMIVMGVLIAIVFVGVVLSLTFAGCAAQPGSQETPASEGYDGRARTFSAVLPSGDSVECVTNAVGLWCTEAEAE